MFLYPRQICEEVRPSEASDSYERSELCVAAPTSLPKDHAKFFVKGLLLHHDRHGDVGNGVHHMASDVSTSSEIPFLSGDIINKVTIKTAVSSYVPQPQLQYIATQVTSSFQALDYRQVISQLDQLSKQGPLSTPVRCAVLLGCGLAYYKLDKHHDATLRFQELAEICHTEVYLRGTQSLAHIYLGDIACIRSSHGEAADHYEKAVAHYSTDSLGKLFDVPMPSVTHICTKWGQALRKVSKVMQAVGAFNKAIAMAADKKEEMSARTSLGNMLQALANHQAAIDEYAKTITIAEELGDHVALGWNHGNIGNAYLSKGERDKALRHLKRSLELTLEHEATPPAIGRAYNNLGTAYQALGELEMARDHYTLGLNQATFGEDVPGQARAHGNLGNISMLKKDYDKAYQSYSETLLLSSDRLVKSTAYHNRGCCLYDKAEEMRSGAEVRSGAEEVRTGPLDEHTHKLYKDASKDFEEVVQYHEETLHTIKGSPKGLSLSVGLFDAHSSTFQRLVDCLFSLGRREEALVVAEQCRSRTLGELLLRRSAQQLATPINYEQMCAIVQSQQHTVVYLAYTGHRLIMWALTPKEGSVTMAAVHVDVNKDLFSGKTLDVHLRYDLPELIADHNLELFGCHDYRERSPLHQLFDIVGKPLLELLGPPALTRREVVLIPDSYTSLPITALCDGTSFMGDRFVFRIMPSLLTMGMISQSPSGWEVVDVHRDGDGDQFCIIGDPNIPPFTHNGEEVALGRLPHAAIEAQWVANTLGTTATLGNHATKQTVLRMLQRAKVVHIATHGGAATGFLAFAGGSGSSRPVEDTSVLLFPHEVEQLAISPVLVVLSSCCSARGKVSADGVISMARAFLLAGAQSILTTLWQVPDESAGVFMKFFYQYLVDGLTSTQALQKAVLSVRCIEKYSKYVHWGAYQLMGRDVRFAPLPEEDDIIGNFRGSVFSQLDILTALEAALLPGTTLPQDPTPVQIIHASPDLDPSQCVLDFVHRHHHHFNAIFYIPATFDELLEAAELSVKEVTPGLAPTDKVLAVLQGMEKLSNLPDALLKLLKRSTTSTIIIHTSPAPPTSIAKEVGSLLLRPCDVHPLVPLPHLHCSQRLVHSVLSRTNLVPGNKEQEVISLLSDLTRGSPIMVDITAEVVCEYCERYEDPMERLVTEVIRPSPVTTGVEGGDTMLAYLGAIIGALGLDSTEHMILCSLAMCGPCPIPAAMLGRVIDIILSGLPKHQHTVDHVIQQLLKRRLVRVHPNVVLMQPTGGAYATPTTMTSSTTSDNKLYYIPDLIAEAILHGMGDMEMVLAAAIAHRAMEHPYVMPTITTSLYHAALSRGLVQTAVVYGAAAGLASLEVCAELFKPAASTSVLKRYG